MALPILHEEMDMMHTLVAAVPPRAPTGLTATAHRRTGVTLEWTDNSIKEVGFAVQRATNANFTLGLTTFNLPKSDRWCRGWSPTWISPSGTILRTITGWSHSAISWVTT